MKLGGVMKRKRVVRVGILLVAIAAAVALASVSIWSQPQQSQIERQQTGLEGRSAVTSADALAPVVGVARRLLTTYVNSCLPSSCSVIVLPAGTQVPLDAVTTITCAAPLGKTCTITLQAWIQTQNTSSTGNNAGSINMLVDGVSTPTYFGGDSPPNAFFYDGLFNRSDVVFGVSRGTHTVQTQARSEFGANGNAWTSTYSVYTP